ncbi:MAG TPA: hypothetical protein VFK05_31785 [Polyangiaceae bacterium]|nr:hypothetical protein [Polyangiaceae bacterium]
MVRFAVNPTPKKGPIAERFAAQLALSRVHPNLIALERTPGGYAIVRDGTLGWFELRAKRGFAGYGLSRALRMLLDLLAGVIALEDTRSETDQPFVHGELMPAMLRVDPTGRTRLIPLAPWHWSAHAPRPVLERCGYLAPERLLGDVLDSRADVFSAGVLLWEALAGRRLFEADSVDTIVTRLLGEKVTIPELPPELSWAVPLKAIAMCAIAADPEQRFANCAEMAEAISAVAGEQLATHAEVLQYFRTPEPVLRPSLGAPPPRAPAHPSSLSALVAPLQQSQPPVPNPSEPLASHSTSPARRSRPSLWALAALSCLLSALGVSAIARHAAAPHARHAATDLGATPSSFAPPLVPAAGLAVGVAPIESTAVAAPAEPTLVQVAPSAEPSLSAAKPSAEPSLVQVVPSAEPSPSAAKPSAEPTLVQVAPSDGELKPASKKPIGGNRVKGAAAQPRLPAKSGRVWDKAAAKYGI